MSKRPKSPILLPAQLRHRLPTSQNSKLPRRGPLSYVIKGIGIVGAFFGTYVAYLEFGPAFTVSALEPVSSVSSLASTPFAITNSSLVDIRDVRFTCDANKANFAGDIVLENSSLINFSKVIPIMRRNETLTVTCPLQTVLDSVVMNAEIDLKITFNGTLPPTNWALPFTSERKFRYCGTLNNSGRGRWYQQPVSFDCFPNKQQPANTR